MSDFKGTDELFDMFGWMNGQEFFFLSLILRIRILRAIFHKDGNFFKFTSVKHNIYLTWKVLKRFHNET